MKALKTATIVTLVVTLALAVAILTLVGTNILFVALLGASEGVSAIAGLVWCLEMVFGITLCFEYFS